MNVIDWIVATRRSLYETAVESDRCEVCSGVLIPFLNP